MAPVPEALREHHYHTLGKLPAAVRAREQIKPLSLPSGFEVQAAESRVDCLDLSAPGMEVTPSSFFPDLDDLGPVGTYELMVNNLHPKPKSIYHQFDLDIRRGDEGVVFYPLDDQGKRIPRSTVKVYLGWGNFYFCSQASWGRPPHRFELFARKILGALLLVGTAEVEAQKPLGETFQHIAQNGFLVINRGSHDPVRPWLAPNYVNFGAMPASLLRDRLKKPGGAPYWPEGEGPEKELCPISHGTFSRLDLSLKREGRKISPYLIYLS